MRYIIRLILMLLLLLSISTGIAYGSPNIVLDGNDLHFNDSTVIENGRTLVTADVLQILDTKVQLFSDSQDIIISKGEVEIRLALEGESYVNGKLTRLDVPAKTVNGKTMLPLRFIGESFGYKVEWDDNTQTVALTSSTSIDKAQEYQLDENPKVFGVRSLSSAEYMSTKNDLLQAMTGHASTNNWDIVCSYNEDIINNIFKEKYRQGKLARDVKLKGTYNDPSIGEIMLESDLTLGEPELQFVAGTRNISQLTMPILSGSCTLTPQSDPSKAKSCAIDPNILQIVGKIPLAATTGDTKEVYDGTHPIIFKDGIATTQQVFLHFKDSSETTFDIVPVPSKEKDANNQVIYQKDIRPEIITLITAFFKEEVTEIDYSMGGISNATQTGILPKSFIFSVSKPDNNSTGCLNLYIQTVNSGNPPGDVNPSFRPAGSLISPVPDGYTASLILSGDFMGKLLASPLMDKKLVFCSNTDGLLMQVYNNKRISYPGYHHDANHWFDGINIDISKTPMYLNLKQDKINVTLNSPSNTGSYANWDNCGGEMLGGSGNITASFSVNETFPLKLNSDGMLQLNCSLNQSGVIVNAVTHVTSGGWMIDKVPIIMGMKNSIPTTIGATSVNMNPVNMFTKSNLSFPEQNKLNFFGGDSFYVPHDLIMFGNISK